MAEKELTVDVIVPVYNESLECVQSTVDRIVSEREHNHDIALGLILVNDGSSAKYPLDGLRLPPWGRIVEHEVNRGYGASLKTGIASGTADFVAITDADGTYPVEDLSKLLSFLPHCDMVTGIRTGEITEIPLLRRFPKMLLNLAASYFAGARIRDLNSGFRVFRRSLAERFWGLFPDGFSFTSTITMASYLGGYRIQEIPINYFKREGSSSIHPIKDTIRFFRLVLRLGLLFAPKRLFTPLALALFLLGLSKGLFRDYALTGMIGNFSLTLMLSGLQIFMMGLIGHLIVLGRFFGRR